MNQGTSGDRRQLEVGLGGVIGTLHVEAMFQMLGSSDGHINNVMS